MKIARPTFTLAVATFLIASSASLYAANHNPKSKDDATKPPTADPIAAARVAAGGDTLLDALLTELDRSKAKLKMDQVQAPYYIEYRVNDLDEYGAWRQTPDYGPVWVPLNINWVATKPPPISPLLITSNRKSG